MIEMKGAFGQLALFGSVIQLIRQSELAGIRRCKKRARALDIRFRYVDFDAPKPIDRKPMRVSQRLTAQERRNARSLQKAANLLRFNLAARHEHASIHPAHFTHAGNRDVDSAMRDRVLPL
jgi:hypothetical protein